MGRYTLISRKLTKSYNWKHSTLLSLLLLIGNFSVLLPVGTSLTEDKIDLGLGTHTVGNLFDPVGLTSESAGGNVLFVQESLRTELSNFCLVVEWQGPVAMWDSGGIVHNYLARRDVGG